jgi:hypothetical protein
VMFAETHRIKADVVRPSALIKGCRVKFVNRRAKLRRAHVVTDDELQANSLVYCVVFCIAKCVVKCAAPQRSPFTHLAATAKKQW